MAGGGADKWNLALVPVRSFCSGKEPQILPVSASNSRSSHKVSWWCRGRRLEPSLPESSQNQVAGRVCTAIQPCFWCVLAFLGVGRHIGFNTALLEERRWHRSCQTLTDPEPCRLCLTSVLRRECSSRPPPSLRHQVFGGRRETTFKRLQDPPWPYWERTSSEEATSAVWFSTARFCPAALEIGQLCHLTAGSAPSGQDIEVAVVSFVWKIQMFLSE